MRNFDGSVEDGCGLTGAWSGRAHPPAEEWALGGFREQVIDKTMWLVGFCARRSSPGPLGSGEEMQITRIPRKVVEEIGYYVYAYVNPSTGRISYVGKGKGQRALAHLLRLRGHSVDLLAHGIDQEATAFLIEAAVIDALGLRGLTNRVRGKGAVLLGRSPLTEVITRYAASPTSISHPCLLIRISQLFRPGMTPTELYEATRGVWKLGRRRERVRYALAVANGVVREVYRIKNWHRAGTTPYRTRTKREVSIPKRWEFQGSVAENSVRDKYRFRSVEHLLPNGSQNPIRYIRDT